MATVLALGLASGFVSWLLQVADPWWSSTLSNVAVAALLLVPAEYALGAIKSGFQRIELATEEIRETADSAKETAERAERSLEDVRESLLERQRSEFRSNLETYEDTLSNPSRETLMRALRKATDEGLITALGVRVPIWETDLHYRFVLGQDNDELTTRIETDSGQVLSSHPWAPDVSPEDFFQTLVLGVRSAGGDLGVGLNDPTQSVEELADMLLEVARLRAQELMGHRGTLCRIIERRDGWYFTEDHVLPADNLHYTIAVSRLNEMDWEDHLRGKGWVGVTWALDFARALYGVNT